MFLFRPPTATQNSARYLFTPRDTAADAEGLAACGRATRALSNYVENLGPFIAMALALIATGQHGGLGAAGATIWILARIVYMPIYVLASSTCARRCGRFL